MNCLVFKLKNRNPDDVSNKYLAEIYSKGPKFDIDLISTDQKVVSAHKYVVCMLSVYLKDYIREFKPKGKACVPLSDVSGFVLKLVVDLFYNGQIMVGTEVKPHFTKALNLLKVANVVIQAPGQQPPPAPSSNGPKPRLMSQPSLNPKSQVPMRQMNNRESNVNNAQYSQIQPAKRQRAQSMYVERPVHGSGMHSNRQALPQPINGMPSRIGGVSITKARAMAPTANTAAMALLQNTQLSISRVQKPTQQQNIAKPVPSVSNDGRARNDDSEDDEVQN